MSIKTAITKGVTKLATKVKVKSPTLLVVGGTATLIVAGVVAAIETHKKLDGVIAEHKEKVAALKDIRDGVVVLDEYTTEDYAANHYKKHLTHVYLTTICKLAKVYAPAFLLALAGTLAILSGHKILTKRHLAAVAECMLTKQTLSEYRKRVAEKVGPEAERLMWLGGEKAIITDREIDPKTGEVKETARESIVGDAVPMSWTYIISKGTVNDALYGISDADCRRRLNQLVDIANQYFTRHDQVSLQTMMGHWWKDEYMRKCPETISNGWLYNDQFIREGRDVQRAITYDIKMIDTNPDDRKYAVTFNVQCNIVDSLALEMKKEKDEKREARKGRKVHATIRPAVA